MLGGLLLLLLPAGQPPPACNSSSMAPFAGRIRRAGHFQIKRSIKHGMHILAFISIASWALLGSPASAACPPRCNSAVAGAQDNRNHHNHRHYRTNSTTTAAAAAAATATTTTAPTAAMRSAATGVLFALGALLTKAGAAAAAEVLPDTPFPIPYDWAKFPTAWFASNATNWEDEAQIAAIGKYSMAILGWQVRIDV